MAGILLRRGLSEDTEIHGEKAINAEAGLEVMQLQTKEQQNLTATPQKLKETRNYLLTP